MVGNEFERTFLVAKPEIIIGRESIAIFQGYIASELNNECRVRIATNSEITIKIGVKPNRTEFTYKINRDEAYRLYDASLWKVIKIRFKIDRFDVDFFLAGNAGLILAEIELASENEEFIKPDWLGIEVTGEERYKNYMLAKQPFSTWQKSE